jgi:hypothetical protein
VTRSSNRQRNECGLNIHHKLHRLCACFVNRFFWSSTWEGHHLLHWKTACGKLGCDGWHSISRSGNGCDCSCGAGNETISAACRHLPWDSSSRGLQQYFCVNMTYSSATITDMRMASMQFLVVYELSIILCGFCSVDHRDDVSFQTRWFRQPGVVCTRTSSC